MEPSLIKMKTTGLEVQLKRTRQMLWLAIGTLWLAGIALILTLKWL